MRAYTRKLTNFMAPRGESLTPQSGSRNVVDACVNVQAAVLSRRQSSIRCSDLCRDSEETFACVTPTNREDSWVNCAM